MVGLLEIWDKINRYYESDISLETKKLCESYAAGVNKYIIDHPSEVYKGVYPITAKDLVAGFVHKTPLFVSYVITVVNKTKPTAIFHISFSS